MLSSNSSVISKPVIQGWIKIRRKTFWAKRYAEILDNVFFYYKNKGDLTPRMGLLLKGAVIQQKSEGNYRIITIISPDVNTQEKEMIQLRFDSISEYNEWYKFLNGSLRGAAVPASSNSPAAAESTARQNSLLLETSIITVNPNVASKPSRRKASHDIKNLHMIDQELLDDSPDGSLLTLKANVYHFKYEVSQSAILVHSSGNLRVFRNTHPKKSENNNRVLLTSMFSKFKESIEKAKSLQKALGNFFFITFLLMAAILAVAVFYFFLDLASMMSFTTSFMLIGNILIFGGNFFLVRLNTQTLEDSRKSRFRRRHGEYRYKSITTIDSDVNEILFLLKQVNCRKHWFPYCTEGNSTDSANILKYLIDNQEYVERFKTSVIRDAGKVYVIDHNDLEIIRLFELIMNDEDEIHVLSLYTRSKSPSIYHIEAYANPLILDSFQAYLRESNSNPKSVVQQYMQINKRTCLDSSFTLESAYIPKPTSITAVPNEGAISRINTFASEKNEEISRINTFVSEKNSHIQEEEKLDLSLLKNSLAEPERTAATSEDLRIQGFIDLTKKKMDEGIRLYDLSLANNWVLESTLKDGTIHFRSDTGSKLLWIRSEFVLKATVDEACTLLLDNKKRMEYDNSCEAAVQIEKLNDYMGISHQKFKGQMMVESRDFCILGRWEKRGENLIVLGATSVEHPQCPPMKKATRGEVILGLWRLEQIEKQPAHTKACYIACVDLKGSLPSSLFKVAGKRTAMVVEEMRKYIEKGKHKQ